MALIGSIRKSSWILISTMVIALVGFIAMDIVSNSQMYSAADANTMGKVNGKDIRTEDFDRYREAIYANSTGNDYQIRNQVWNQFVEDALVREQAEPIGIGVPRDEMNDLQFGQSLSPVIIQRYSDQSGRVDMNTLQQIKTAIEQGTLEDVKYADFRTRWSVQLDEIKKQRLQDKMTNMVLKGIYTPAWQAEMTYAENAQRVDYLYVRVPYDKVADADIQVTEADYSAYIKENPRLLEQQDETRVLSYVAFDVMPTSADSTGAKDLVMGKISGLRTGDSIYVINQNGIYTGSYQPKSALPLALADRLIGAPLDSVVGPILDGGSWTIAKVFGRKVLPDSVRARHILIKDPATANQKIDSLKNLIETGKATFDALAKTNSEDPGSGIKGGDLGFFGNGAMVPEFNAVCFETGEQGKLYKTTTQFGVHLIEITGKKFTTNTASVKAAFISELIRPSKNTQQAVKDKALEMLNSVKSITELDAKASALNMKVEASQPLKAADFNLGLLGSGSDTRAIVKWAYDKDSKEGKVAKEVFTIADANGGYFDSKYVLAGLRNINEKGAATVSSVKSNPSWELEVKNRKKAEVITAKLQGASDLAAAANSYGMVVDTAIQGTMMNVNTPKGGPEPRVVGTVFALNKGQVSKPIAGKTGVYMVQPLGDKQQPASPPDLTMFRNQVKSTASSGFRASFMNSLKKNAKVADNRSIFY
jgi:peptidyl-prolyl cis-trans isomerase D